MCNTQSLWKFETVFFCSCCTHSGVKVETVAIGVMIMVLVTIAAIAAVLVVDYFCTKVSIVVKWDVGIILCDFHFQCDLICIVHLTGQTLSHFHREEKM